MNKFLHDLWAKYAHVRTLVLVLGNLQGMLVGLHPTSPNSVRAIALAGQAITWVLWYLKGPHVDVDPTAPGISADLPNPETVLEDVPGVGGA